MSVRWQIELPQWAIIAWMFITAGVLWPTTAARVPVHWSATGKVNGYGGRFEGLLLMPHIALGLSLLLLFIPGIDPGRANYAQFANVYLIVRVAVLVMMAGFYAFTIRRRRRPAGRCRADRASRSRVARATTVILSGSF